MSSAAVPSLASLAVISACIAGCGSEKIPATSAQPGAVQTEEARHDARTREVQLGELGVVGKAPPNDDAPAIQVNASENLRISGSYTLGPGMPSRPVLLRIIERRGGKNIVCDSFAADAEDDADGTTVHFRGTLKSPSSSGDFEFEVFYEKDVFARRRVEVKPN